jgi:hypothetical protein
VTLAFFVSSLLLFVYPVPIHAHPGRTDSSGGHTCRTNCASWGYGQGEYHYHGGNGSSGGASESTYTAPVVETYEQQPVVIMPTNTPLPTRLPTRSPTRIPTRTPTPTVNCKAVTNLDTVADSKAHAKSETCPGKRPGATTTGVFRLAVESVQGKIDRTPMITTVKQQETVFPSLYLYIHPPLLLV